MDVREETRPVFYVLGQLGRGSAGEGPAWIPPLWQRANERFGEIAPLALHGQDGNLAGLWGAMSDVEGHFHPWGQEGLYLAGCEVAAGTVPPTGWTLWRIPAQRYLVVGCTQQTYGEVFRALLSDALPARGHQLAGAVHERYHDAGDGGLELYFPIERY